MNAAVCIFLGRIQDAVLNPLIVLVSVIAFVLFVYGMMNFIRSADDAEKRSEGQRHMIWAIIGLVIIFGAKGIAVLVAQSAGLPGLPTC